MTTHTISIELLRKLQISANQALILLTLSDSTLYQQDLFSIPGVSETFDKDIETLINKGLISGTKLGKSLRNLKVTDKYIEETEIGKTQFEELYETFPTAVKRPDGSTDFLKTNKEKCWWAYLQATAGDRAKHDYIIKALKWEIEDRQNHGTLGYMRKLLYWIKDASWNIYEGSNNKPITSYGDDIE